jgi:hypothetical protein
MEKYERTALWRKTLGSMQSHDTDGGNREHLRSAYRLFRERAAMLAGEIALDLPDFTVHDVTHLDALWDVADLVAGPDYPLTPAEAFVLGGCFLIHDLGMGIAAYPDGVSSLEKSSLWSDTVASLLRERHSIVITAELVESPPAEIRQEATRRVLRELHASQAEQLALVSWSDRNSEGSRHYLIEDGGLRKNYGALIGKIAHSHWWPVDQLEVRLPKPIGAPSGYDKTWTVDPVKLACILRAADASHIDERRAPGFLASLRRPQGTSADHWLFQERLYQPRLDAERLVYASKTSFALSEVGAWWTCYDTLQMIDKELRNSDALLADTGRPRLAAKGVAHSEDPMRLAAHVQIAGWIPIDAKIRVGNVARLVLNLGGEKLYGRHSYAPLRELIQNGCDAVQARRLLEKRSSTWGSVTLRYGEDSVGKWIEVEDTGVGMSRNVLTGPLLDFGNSLWGTPMMHREFPGLETSGFTSTGQFGIGFFSVFMLGDRVRVITRRAEAARDDTIALEFQYGVGSRPILRNTTADEKMRDGGTCVRVWIRDQKTYDEFLVGFDPDRDWTIEARCAWLCPAINVDLHVGPAQRQDLVVAASDWLTIPADKLLARLNGPPSKGSHRDHDHVLQEMNALAAQTMSIIVSSSGNDIGRCAITLGHVDHEFSEVNGTVCVGGFRANSLIGIAGIMNGIPHTAARTDAIPFVDDHALGLWASAQANRVAGNVSNIAWQVDIAETIRALGGLPHNLPIALDASGWLNANDVAERYSDAEEVLLVQDASWKLASNHDSDATLQPGVIVVATGIPGILGSRDHWLDWPSRTNLAPFPTDWQFHNSTLLGLVIEMLAASWGANLGQVLSISIPLTDDVSIKRPVWVVKGHLTEKSVTVIRNPNRWHA